MVAVAEEPATTVPELGFTPTEKSFTGWVLLVNGAKILVKSHLFWAIPEQSSRAAAPAQLPLSRCSAQKDSVLMPFETAQL